MEQVCQFVRHQSALVEWTHVPFVFPFEYCKKGLDPLGAIWHGSTIVLSFRAGRNAHRRMRTIDSHVYWLHYSKTPGQPTSSHFCVNPSPGKCILCQPAAGILLSGCRICAGLRGRRAEQNRCGVLDIDIDSWYTLNGNYYSYVGWRSYHISPRFFFARRVKQ